MYYTSPPGLRLLHCLRNTSSGSSIFVDSFRVATLLRMRHLHSYLSLTQNLVAFQYLNDNRHFYFSRPIIEPDITDPHGLAIAHINYAPSFQGPFEFVTTRDGRGSWVPFVVALKTFAGISEEEYMKFEQTMNEGECVVFANRRVLHARKGFGTASGETWLKGIYVDWDDFQVSSSIGFV
jgi:gamma-butyrobetaine dioxygenase